MKTPLETGLKFGRMHVLEEVRSDIYLCQCQCGARETRRRGNILRARACAINSACAKCVKAEQHATNPFRSPHVLKRSAP